MPSIKMQITVGVFVIASFIALTILAFKVSNIEEYATADNYVLIAHFDNVGGLKIRSPIKVGGVVVGRIQDIQLDDDLLPKVSMSINGKFNKFPTETSAAILTAGLLGEQYISLTPGGDDEILKPGDEIDDTQSAIILEDLIGQFLFNKGGSSESL
ncbi:MAG TPA: outer membrane lipid asymmetry maintenance protein MlaD [Aeromonadales bacterium]|nr:outer membrane lipid asymmetry maintenance protein MlaD [Aeromonadales bacterium]